MDSLPNVLRRHNRPLPQELQYKHDDTFSQRAFSLPVLDFLAVALHLGLA